MSIRPWEIIDNSLASYGQKIKTYLPYIIPYDSFFYEKTYLPAHDFYHIPFEYHFCVTPVFLYEYRK